MVSSAQRKMNLGRPKCNINKLIARVKGDSKTMRVLSVLLDYGLRSEETCCRGGEICSCIEEISVFIGSRKELSKGDGYKPSLYCHYNS